MKKLFLVINCFLGISCFSQNSLTLDLSKGDVTESISPQSISSLVLVNNLATAGTNYTIDVSIKHIPQHVLTIPGGGANGVLGIATCKTIEEAIDKLEKESDEADIPKDIENLQKEMKSASAACIADIPEAQIVIDATTTHRTLPVPLIISKGDELTIVIKRGAKTWTFKLRNEQPNHWTTYYGFTYIPDVFTKFSNYYANQQTGGSYIISKMNGSNKNVLQNVSPTAMFTYRFFDKHPDFPVKFGLTGGIFYNTEILGAMFGPSLIIADNVTLNTGISFVQKYKLKGQYKDGQTIQDNLTFDQLHDKIWTYDMFISIGFNIPELFTKKSSGAKAETTNGTSDK